ncbi:MAG: 4-hydroxybenzoate octaprenyltransferase [Gammaproteobacteria bacterium]|nr:MAG: 4-hydroxybenzoate octaprenyltransferase [Gammaproteobacteria bacterium]
MNSFPSPRPSWTSRIPDFVQLMRLDRPIGTLLLLWPTLWAIWISGAGKPDLKVTLIFTLGVLFMRSAGCVINDIADRKIDGKVERTKNRPLATNKISLLEALITFAILISCAFVLVLFTNTFTIVLSLGAAAIACTYPLMKRYTYLPQVVLGAAFAWCIPMSFAAHMNEIPSYAWLIYIATLIWTVAYDTMYAMVDRNDDLKIGVKSTAILFGDNDRAMIGVLQGLTVLCLILVGNKLDFNGYYYASLGVVVILFLYQQLLIKRRSRKGCLKAFLNNNWVGMAVFVGILLHYITV